MAVIGFSLAERFSRWQVLANNLKETPTAISALSDELSQLDTLLADARTLQDRQAELRSRAREITRQLVEIAKRGDNVRSRMGAILQGKLGFTSTELLRYGFSPRRVPRRRPKQQEPTEKAPPAAAEAGTPDDPTS